MRLRAAGVAAVCLLVGVTSSAAAPGRRSVAGPTVQLSVRLDRGAVLGGASALRAQLRIDPRRMASPLLSVGLLYPSDLGLVSSGLGLAACRRPAAEFQQILLDRDRLGCPANAVLGHGTVEAEVHIGGQIIPEHARMTVLTGPIEHGTLRVVSFIEGYRPFGARLLYGGELGTSPAGTFGALTVRVPPIPSLADWGASVLLTSMRLTIGGPEITYYRRAHGRRIAYHPAGIQLPDTCPPTGFRFRARLSFENGTTTVVDATVPCPARTRH